MSVELGHPFSTTRALDDSYATILDLERVIPCVEGGSVIERPGPDSVRAEIKVKMGAIAMTDAGGTIHTNAQITGKAASMGEGVVSGVLDALIKDFTEKLGAI